MDIGSNVRMPDKAGFEGSGTERELEHIHPLVAWLRRPSGRCSPDSLDPVPPPIAEGAIHHDGSHAAAQVVAKEEQGKKRRGTDVHKGSPC